MKFYNKGITAIRQLPNSIFTFGIRFGGISLMKDTIIIGTITEKEGLLDNSIKYLLPDGDRLWAATSKGISCISFTSYSPLVYTIKNFGEDVGLSDQIIYQLIKYQGNILAATSKGVYEINNVEKLLSEKPLPIPLYITTVNTYKGDTANVTSITVSYYKSRVSVKFNAICFNTPKQVKYFYRIVNEDSTWYGIDNPEVVLQNLWAGEYNVEIKAEVKSQSRVSSIQKITIIIDKPWWQKNSTIAVAFILFFGSIYAIYQWRINAIKKKQQEKNNVQAKMTELEQTALRSQMNPHFIFNCLTSIQQLITTGKKDDANEYLVKFSRLIRKTLELSSKQYITIFDEVEYLKEYTQLEQLRMPEQFVVTFTIDENIVATKTEIPNMMLQPIVENAIRHGIKQLENKNGVLKIDINKQQNAVVCTIEDNGVGRTNNKSSYTNLTGHKSYGMDIVKQRLSGLSINENKNYDISIIDLTDANNQPIGTKVMLKLPYKII